MKEPELSIFSMNGECLGSTNITLGIFHLKEGGRRSFMQKTTRNCGDPVPGVACYVARVAKSGAQVGTGDDTKGIRGFSTLPFDLKNFAKEDSSIVGRKSDLDDFSESVGGQDYSEREGSKEGLHGGMRVAIVTD